MQIQIIRATVCGGEAREVGAIIEATERDARVLIQMKKAVAVVDTVVDAPVKRRGRPKVTE